MKKANRIISIVMAFVLVSALFSVLPLGVSADPVAYSQYDSRWRYWTYGGGDIGTTGCGILSTVNALNHLVGIDDIGGAIDSIATWAHNRGAFNAGSGDEGTTRGALYPYLEDAFGDTYGFVVDEGSVWGNSGNSTLKNHLASGGVAVAHVPGHFICLAAYDSSDDTFLVLDSAPTSARNTVGGAVWRTTYQLGNGNANLKVDWFCLISAAPTPEPSTVRPYLDGDGSLYLADCDSMNGWVSAFNTDLRLETATSPAGNFMVLDAGSPEADNSANVGAMAFYEFDEGYEADTSDYNYITFELYCSIDYKTAGRDDDYFQINFCTVNQDGFNIRLYADELSQGWHTYTIRKSSIDRVVSESTWTEIRRMRFTWFNTSHGGYVEFALDTVKAVRGPVEAYEQSNELMLIDCDQFTGWTCAWGTHLGIARANNPPGQYLGMDNEEYDHSVNRESKIGGMLYYTFSSAVDMSDYSAISFEVATNNDSVSAGRTNDLLELTFVSSADGDTGYRYNIPISDLSDGWQTISIPFSAFRMLEAASWSNIWRFKVAWINNSGGSRVDFVFDTFKATHDGDIPNRVIQLDDCGDSSHWGWHDSHAGDSSGQEIWWEQHNYCYFDSPKDLSGLESVILNMAEGADHNNANQSVSYANLLRERNGKVILTSYPTRLGQGENSSVFNGNLRNHEAFTAYGCPMTASAMNMDLVEGDNTFAVDLSRAGASFDATAVTGILFDLEGTNHDLWFYNISAECNNDPFINGGFYISTCDSVANWAAWVGDNLEYVSDKKTQGDGSLHFYNTGGTSMYYKFEEPHSHPTDFSNVEYIEFDIIPPAADYFATVGGIFITLSSRDYDNNNEGNWSDQSYALDTSSLRNFELRAGEWNHIRLPIAGGTANGGFDITSVKKLRLGFESYHAGESHDLWLDRVVALY